MSARAFIDNASDFLFRRLLKPPDGVLHYPEALASHVRC